MSDVVVLEWRRFTSFIEARRAFAKIPCVYAQADPEGLVIRVGKASKGLEARYWGGNGYALEAAMHASRNLVFVAAVDPTVCEPVEAALIWEHRERLIYNNVGKRTAPPDRLSLQHAGTPPRFA